MVARHPPRSAYFFRSYPNSRFFPLSCFFFFAVLAMFLDRSSAIFHGSNKETVLTQNPSQGFSVRLFSGISLCFSRHFTAYCKRLPNLINASCKLKEVAGEFEPIGKGGCLLNE